MKIGIWLFFVHHSLMVRTAFASSVRHAFMVTFPGTELPPSLKKCSKSGEAFASRLACAVRCASELVCLSSYSVREDNQWTCYHCTDLDTSEVYPNGEGFYSYMTGKDLGPEPPSIPNTSFEKTDLYEGRPTAFYQCTNGRNFKIRLGADEKPGMWPQFGNANCLTDMCEQDALTASRIVVTIGSGGFTVTPSCRYGEIDHGVITRCTFNGNWVDNGQSGVACTSALCYRVSHNNHAYYNGDMGVAYGRVCQEWIEEDPTDHPYIDDSLFPEDLNRQGASNSCRDPANNGYTWCYTLGADPKMTQCSVPACL